MNPKSGIHTSEFWITAIVNIAGAILAILAAYGLIVSDHQELWITLIQALAVAIVPIVIGLTNNAYIESRGKVKAAALKDPEA